MILHPIINEGNILNQSFNEQKEIIKPLQVEFKEQLEIHTVTDKDTFDKLSCAICQDVFTLNEHIIKLPCNEKSHFFHKENTEECNGILPWFEEHNTCPVCREEYPSEPEPEPEPEPEQVQLPESLVSTVDITLTPEQIRDLNIMRENLGTPPPDNITLDEIDNTITNEINTVLRMLFMGNNEEQGQDNNGDEEQENNGNNEHEEQGNEDNEIENIQQIITPLMNNILLDEMIRRREDEDLQTAIIQSLGEL